MLSGSETEVKQIFILGKPYYFRIYVEWSGVQDYQNNKTTITVNFYIEADYINVVYRDCYININGENYEFKIDLDNLINVKKTLIYTVTHDIYHDKDGIGTLELEAEWKHDDNPNDIYVKVDKTYSLDTIDRNPPEVVISGFESINMYDFIASASSNVLSDRWSYSLDGGNSWSEETTDLESVEYTFNPKNLSKETFYNVVVRCRRMYNGVYGQSSQISVKTIGSTELISASFNPVDDEIVTGSVNLKVLDVSHYHKLNFEYGENVLFTSEPFLANNGENSITFTSDERQKVLYTLRNSKDGLFYLSVETYLDEACTQKLHTVSSIMVWLTTTEKSKPDFMNFTFEDTINAVVDVTGDNQVLVQKYSNLLVHCLGVTPHNEASIVRYEVSVADLFVESSSPDINVGRIFKDGEHELSVSCIDSRGYVTTIKKSLRVITYVDPNINSITLRRKNEVDRLVELSFRGAFSKIDAVKDIDTNTITVAQYRYKVRSDEDYSEYISLLDDLSINSNSFSFDSLELIELEVEKTYDFQIQIKDRLGDMTVFEISLVLNKLTPAVAIRGGNSQYPFTRVGINNNAPKEALDIIGKIAMNGYYVLGYIRTLENGEGLRAQNKGGVYLFDGSYSCYDHPETGGLTPGILEVVVAGGFVIQRFTTLVPESKEYKSAYNGTSWSMWKE